MSTQSRIPSCRLAERLFLVPGGGAPNRLLQPDGFSQAEQLLCAVDAGDVTRWGCAGDGLAGDLDLRIWVEGVGYGLREFENAEVAGRSYVDGGEGGGAQQDGPKPDGKVGCVKVGASCSTVALNLDGPAGEDVCDEVTDSEVPIEGQVGSAEGPAAGDFALQGGLRGGALLIEGAEEFGDALALGVDAGGTERVGRALKGFRHVRELWWLGSVYGAGAGKQEFVDAVSGGKLQGALGAGNDGGEHLQ